ncbi:CheF family chemotaxis protein [Halococcoides cellulosivorans]|uniref:Taxis protein CheF n=1 Tax=Halococcoides cellulosivorans TaxID=1679096 RepID=A0A2R4WZE2_9EURY|nr:CheF family chemotaxis protein [Halococcoides cellulosivorans]AWB26901.1 chemotaxis protein CheF1 [Halococcoides cellulosivorans]
MAEGESKIAEHKGQVMHAVREGREVHDAEWRPVRIVLTTERLVLVGEEQTAIPLDDVERSEDRYDVNQAAATTATYTAISVGEDVYLIDATEQQSFETDYFQALIDGEIIRAKHPAIVGGVVQDSPWSKAKVKITDEAVKLALADGSRAVIGRDDIGDVETETREIDGERREVFEVEHTDPEGRSVETHVTGADRHLAVLETVLRQGVEQIEANLDLSGIEKRVVMALHSGVSSFDLPEFVDADVERVEEIFDQLIEYDVVEVDRERTEVELTPEGRRVAGETMGEQ